MVIDAASIKSLFIRILAVLLLCAASFGAGRFLRIGGLAEDSGGAQQSAGQLAERITELQSELDARVAECERLQSELDSVGAGIDESISAARRLAGELGELRGSLVGNNAVIEELRRRFGQYEARARELEGKLESLERGSSQQ